MTEEDFSDADALAEELGIEEFDPEKIKDPKKRKRIMEFMFFQDKFEERCRQMKQLNYFKKQIEKIEDRDERAEKLRDIKKDIDKLDDELLYYAKEVLKRHCPNEKKVSRMLEAIDYCWRCKRATRLPSECDGKIICVENCMYWDTLYDICQGIYSDEEAMEEPSYQEWLEKMIKRKEREINEIMYR